ncbi:MAG TPA: Stk1 family PASTA domain-containing Ser/Thr kinase, partial [Actinomycetota bacterium]|nr:Stk1 family PASTA domain-containing Ser/Thr kinase [Actinomycetota bacterium]
VMTGKLYGERYEITGPIATGGMSEVFMARDHLLNRTVAVKVLDSALSRDRTFIERFRREAQAAASLNDPHIVSIFDWGAMGGDHYIVMEYVEGRNLRDLITTEGPLTLERAAEIASDVCSALEVAHSQGIVHRDVKPANIAITPKGQTKVMDFGIARAVMDGETVTQAGTVIGTANYLSPEQAQGLPVDARSDVYSTGVVLYEMLTQQVPFKADTAVAIAYKHVKEDPLPPSSLNPEVSPPLDAVVMKALAKNPDNRYQSAEEMRLDLGRVLRGQAVEATPLLSTDRTSLMGAGRATSVMESAEVPRGRKALAYTLIFALFASLLVLAVLGLFALFGKTTPTVAVPDVRGLSLTEAQRTLDAAGLKSIQDRLEFSESVSEGNVISQDPPDGRKVPSGSKVNLVVSNGPERVEVPDLSGKTEEEARSALEDVGLTMGSVSSAFSDSVAQGKVISQEPAAGVRVDRNRSVDVVVSGGKRTSRVPDVVGLDEAVARQRITDAGLNAVVREVCNTSEKDGRVLDQDPPARQEVGEGSNVKITVNRAPTIPSVLDMTEANAKNRLETAGFKVKVVHTHSLPGEDRVIAQDPVPSTVACKGDTVTITIDN